MANQWGIPKEVEEAVLKRDLHCVYCGCEFGSERAKMRSWEHIINDVNIATLENIALCCIGCNASKGQKLLTEWLASPRAKLRGVTEATLAPVVLAARANAEHQPISTSKPLAIHLYHCVSARSFRPLWMLEELQAPYRLHMLPFPPRALQRSYLDINPLGTVPLLLDGDTRMTESSAMCQYLAERLDPQNQHGLAVRPDEADFGAWLNGLHHGEATLTFPQTIVLRYGRFEPPERKLPQAAQDYSKWFLARLRGIDAALAASPSGYLCAGRFTAADVSVGYALMLAGYLDLETSFPPAVAAYWQRLQQRNGFQRALAAQARAAAVQGVPATHSPEAPSQR